MASTRAEAMARYARFKRVTDVTLIRGDRRRNQALSAFDHWSGPETETHDALPTPSAAHLFRACVLIGGCLTMTPVLSAILG
jgi:hypothetical protein